MVGAPRSRGCSTCRKRKKKCGEERPACLACISAGWECPGYARSWKFVEENQQLRKQYAKKDYAFDSEDPAIKEDRIFLYEIGKAHEVLSSEHGTLQIGISWPLVAAPGEKIGSLLCHILTDPASQHVFQLQSLGNFFQFVPSRLGHNSALDSSISCLCSIFTSMLQDKSTMSASTLNRYGKSIKALQKCLHSQDMRCDPNTICASIILQLCELMTCQDTGRWNTLSRGSEALIRECGPRKFRAPFERALLESQRAFFIVQNMAIGRPCFLAEQQWRDVLDSPDPSLTRHSRSIALRSELCSYVVDIPDLISETTSFLSERPLTPSSFESDFEKRRLHLRNRTSELSEELKAWHRRNFGDASVLIASIKDEESSKVTDDFRDISKPEETLFWVINCVVNTILMKLEQILFAMDVLSDDIDELGHLRRLEEYLKHEELAKKALETVGSYSKIATKPLKFGLSQLWSGGDVMATSWSRKLQPLLDDSCFYWKDVAALRHPTP